MRFDAETQRKTRRRREERQRQKSAEEAESTSAFGPDGWGRKPRSRLRRFFLRVGHVFFVRALEVFDFAVVEVPDAGGDFVDQIVIVGDQDHRALVLLEREVEGVDGLEIEMIGGLVEHQEVGLLEHQAAEDEAGSSSTRKLGFW